MKSNLKTLTGVALGIFIILFQASLAQTKVSEQSQVSEKKTKESRLFFTCGWQKMNLGDLNTALISRGYAGFSEDYLTIGVYGYSARGRFITTVESYLIFPDETTGGSYATRFSGDSGCLSLGYLLTPESELNIYPLAGIGWGHLSFRISETGTPAFAEILDNPRRSSSLKRTSLILDLGLCLDHLIIFSKGNRKGPSLAFGVRVGYMFAPYKKDWHLFDRKVSNGPEAGFEGFYIRGLLGIGGYRKKK